MGASKKKPKVIGAKKPMYKSPLGSKKKFNFSHMRASKCADIRKFIAVPNTKAAKMTAEELRKELQSEATELAKPMVCKSMFLTNMLVKKFNELMEELGEEKVPNPHRALMFLGYLKRQNYSVSYISKGLTCLKYHPNLEAEYNDVVTHPDVRNALANLRKNILQVKDSRIPLTINAVTNFEQIMDKDSSENAKLIMKTGMWLGLTCML